MTKFILATIFTLITASSVSALDVTSGVEFNQANAQTTTRLNLNLNQVESIRGVLIQGNFSNLNASLDGVGNIDVLGNGVSGSGLVANYRFDSTLSGNGTTSTVSNTFSNGLKAFNGF